MKQFSILFLIILIFSCSNNRQEQISYENKDSIFNDEMESFNKEQAKLLPTQLQLDSMRRDEAINASLGNFKSSKLVIKLYEYYNNLSFLSVDEIRKLCKSGFIKKDLYILKAGFDYDQNFETQFRVKFINLTDEIIASVQIGDIDIETMYPFTNKYFKEHNFFVPGCQIKPGEVKIISFFANKDDVETNMMQYQQGIGAIVYNLEYIVSNGNHIVSNRNVTTNLKWKFVK